MSTQIRISAKNLGELGLASFCPRCFWLKLKLGNKLPFQIFPGIFSSIDSYTKSVVHGYFDIHDCPPEWLVELGKIKGYVNPPHFSKYQIVDDDNDILLTGGPDAVFMKNDGSYIIVDYKTARYSKAQDSLLPMYEIQLNAYGLIGERCGFKPVTDLALIYMEPKTDKEAACLDASYHESGFNMQFDASIHKVKLQPQMIYTLLAQVREIFDLKEKPEKKAGCKDCEALAQLLQLL